MRPFFVEGVPYDGFESFPGARQSLRRNRLRLCTLPHKQSLIAAACTGPQGTSDQRQALREGPGLLPQVLLALHFHVVALLHFMELTRITLHGREPVAQAPFELRLWWGR